METATQTRLLTNTEREVFDYLNELRESGVTNMFGARPFILREFPELSEEEAGKILRLWMKHFKSDGNYQDLEIKMQ